LAAEPDEAYLIGVRPCARLESLTVGRKTTRVESLGAGGSILTHPQRAGSERKRESRGRGRSTMSAASAIYFLNLRGDVILYRLYRDDAIGYVWLKRCLPPRRGICGRGPSWATPAEADAHPRVTDGHVARLLIVSDVRGLGSSGTKILRKPKTLGHCAQTPPSLSPVAIANRACKWTPTARQTPSDSAGGAAGRWIG
jgi:hypothetical protein